MTITEQRRRQIADFYDEYATTLERIVARRVHGGAGAIEDACQNAWATLLRRPDITLDHRGLKWLATVAIRDAWRHTPAAETPAGDLFPAGPHSGPDALPLPAAVASDPADLALARVEHEQRVALLQALGPRQREALSLHGLGYSYHEIAALTASTYTAVNRRITEGRARLRRLADQGGE